VSRPIQEPDEIGLEESIRCIEHLPAWNDHDIKAAGGFVVAKDFTNEAPGPIPQYRRAKFPRCRNTQARSVQPVVSDEHRHEPARQPGASLVGVLEVRSLSDVFGRTETGHAFPVHLKAGQLGRSITRRRAGYRSSATVSRLRPLARRRFSTSRPSFVDIRTRNPWVFARRRLFGWNVRLPFFDLAIGPSNEPPILVSAREGCKGARHVRVGFRLSQSFPHLWKNLWKSPGFPA
jgi:hypothetical protein